MSDWGWLGDLVSVVAPAAVSYYIADQKSDALTDSAQQAAAIQSDAAQRAIDAQMQMAQMGIDTQREFFNTTMARQEPFRQAGLDALPKMKYYAGVPNSGYSLDPRVQELNRLYSQYVNSVNPVGTGAGGGGAGGAGGTGVPTGGGTGTGGVGVSAPEGPSPWLTIGAKLLTTETGKALLSKGVSAVAEALGISTEAASSVVAGAEAGLTGLGLGEPVAGSITGSMATPTFDAASIAADPFGVSNIAGVGQGMGAFAGVEAAAYNAAIEAGLSQQVAQIAAQNAGLYPTVSEAVAAAEATAAGGLGALGATGGGFLTGAAAAPGISAGAIGGTAGQLATANAGSLGAGLGAAALPLGIGAGIIALAKATSHKQTGYYQYDPVTGQYKKNLGKGQLDADDYWNRQRTDAAAMELWQRMTDAGYTQEEIASYLPYLSFDDSNRAGKWGVGYESPGNINYGQKERPSGFGGGGAYGWDAETGDWTSPGAGTWGVQGMPSNQAWKYYDTQDAMLDEVMANIEAGRADTGARFGASPYQHSYEGDYVTPFHQTAEYEWLKNEELYGRGDDAPAMYSPWREPTEPTSLYDWSAEDDGAGAA